MHCDWKSLLEVLEVKTLVPSSTQRDAKVLHSLLNSPARTHYWSQAQALSDPKRDHRFRFLKPLLSGWRRKLLPSTYGLWIEFEGGHRPQGFYLQVRGASLEAYYRPSPPRGKSSEQVVRWLSERHGVPVQTLQISRSDWALCLQSTRPWKELARTLRSGRASIASTAGLMTWFKYLS